jgi:hypothetical protein
MAILVRDLADPNFKAAFTSLCGQQVSFQTANNLRRLAQVVMPEVNKWDEEYRALQGSQGEESEEKKSELLARESQVSAQPIGVLQEFRVSAAEMSFLTILFQE